MKRWLIALALCLAASTADAAVAHVKSDKGQCTATSNGTLNMAASGSCVGSVVTIKFTYTATTTNDAVLFATTCADSAGTPSAVSLTASGWTLTQVGTITGNTTGGWTAMYRAYAPNTTAATFTATWTATTCGSFFNDLIDEFSGTDATNFVDASNAKAGTTGGCPSSVAGNGVTPTVANDGIWFACTDNVTAVTGAYTAGGNDAVGDWSEWKILAGGSGTEQFAGLTSSGAFTLVGVAIKPSGAVSCTPTLTLLGVGRCG